MMINNNNTLDWNMKQLYNGCILAGIAHAMMVAHYPVVANEHSWEGLNYSVQNSAGCRGTVTFCDKYCVGAFRNEKSERVEDEFMPAVKYLQNAPLDVIETAGKEAFQYLLDYDIDDEIVPVITTAFWGDDKSFHINDTYDDFIEHGGFLLLRQAMDYEEAINAWIDEYEMTQQQVDLLISIYKRKIADPENDIMLTKEEIAMIGSDDPEGMEECRISFKELNIYLEE